MNSSSSCVVIILAAELSSQPSTIPFKWGVGESFLHILWDFHCLLVFFPSTQAFSRSPSYIKLGTFTFSFFSINCLCICCLLTNTSCHSPWLISAWRLCSISRRSKPLLLWILVRISHLNCLSVIQFSTYACNFVAQ